MILQKNNDIRYSHPENKSTINHKQPSLVLL